MIDPVTTTPPGMIRTLAKIASDANRERDRVEGRAPTQHVEDRNWAMTDALSHFQAETVEEAAIQLAWAISVADIWANATTERADEERHHRALQRLLHSALHAVKREHQIDLHAAGYGPLDDDNCDPWRKDTETVAKRETPEAATPLEDLIREHEAAMSQWLEAAQNQDAAESKLPGQKIEPPPELGAARARFQAATRVEKAVLKRLLEYRPKSLAEVQRRTTYLSTDEGVWDRTIPDPWEIEAFLSSLAEEAA